MLTPDQIAQIAGELAEADRAHSVIPRITARYPDATNVPGAVMWAGSVTGPLAPPDEGSTTPVPSVDGAGVTPPSAPSSEPAVDWVAEVWIDPAWYAAQESPDRMPSPGLPAVVGLRSKSVLVGRTSQSRNIHPEVDCDTDSGVSRRQAQLTTDGTRWWVEDLDSANGTFVGSASGSLPEDPIAVGVKRELAPDDRVYLGAWTRIVIRPATDDERATL